MSTRGGTFLGGQLGHYKGGQLLRWGEVGVTFYLEALVPGDDVARIETIAAAWSDTEHPQDILLYSVEQSDREKNVGSKIQQK